ncbi:MAG: cation:proton antiporter [Roseburia sp.]|nr:cation:proton antiporter [Anaeroplasma bactoclasticum]MCM1196467.1 cation:proton antiporter [Roseburia sp.]MCM1557210.1 cation:proton antiporter [Anaeroplasma bactoclasticum]
MFLSLFIIFTLGVIGGYLFEKLRLPRLVWYLILGILFGPSLFNIIDPNLLQISSYLRQIALVIILTRSGLSLNIKTLKEIGRPAILMCFVPACFEIVGVAIFAPLFLGISYAEALLLGSVLAAVSPAVVIPRMIEIKERGYGDEHHIPELIMAGASSDDIFVIILFYGFKNLVASSSFDAFLFLQIPLSIILGVLLGILVGILLYFIFKYFKLNTIGKTILMLGCSFGMIALEECVKEYISISSLLGIIVVGILILMKNKETAKEVQKNYNALWNVFEILLFVLVGCAVDMHYAFSKEGGILLGIIILSLCFRGIGVLACLIATKYTLKEKIFILLSYLPKATVQASIGGIALSEGLACGTIVITAAVISILVTAPIGALLMDYSYPKLLEISLSKNKGS